MKTIALGTTSKHKVRAAESAVARAGAPLEIRAVKTAPGVPEQPVGLDQTATGAVNRARAALGAVPEAVYGLGVESGILVFKPHVAEAVAEELAYVDLAVVAMVSRAGAPTAYATSVGVQFPKDAVERSWAMGQAKTAGDLIAEDAARRGVPVDGTDPHDYLTGGKVKRNELLEQAIFAVLAERK